MEQIITFLGKKTGFLFDDRKKEALSSIIEARVKSVSFGSEELYLAHLRSPDGLAELVELIGHVTVGETYFLRNKQHWHALNGFVLPMIANSNRGRKQRIKIWSAGCSTGEEPYSIAVSILESLPFSRNWDISIAGTDINDTFLERARKGIYSKNAFRGVKAQWIEKWFTKEKRGYRIKSEVRKMVKFLNLNLISQNGFPLAFSDLDIIFCRNVMMYFRPEVYQRVFRQFAESLKPGGFLFLGYAEGSMAPKEIFEARTCCDTFIYQKRANLGIQNWALGSDKETSNQATFRKYLKSENRSTKPPKFDGKHSIPPHAGIGNDKVRDLPIPKSHRPQPKVGDHHSYDAALALYFKEHFDAALRALPQNDTQNSGLKELILKTVIQTDSSDLINAEISLRELFDRSDILPEAHVLEAMIKEGKGDYEGAVKAYQAALFLDKAFFLPHFRLAQVRSWQGEAERAVRHFKNALKSLKADREERVMLFSGGVRKELMAEICRKRLEDFGA